MKKLVTLALVLALALTMSIAAFADTATPSAPATKDVTASYVAGSDVVHTYSADVTFGAMTFTYNDAHGGTWLPEEGRYDGAAAAFWEAEGNDIVVENKSDLAINVTFAYADNEEEAQTVAGAFYTAATEGDLIEEAVELDPAASTTAYLVLSGALTAAPEANVGTITVSIAAA